MQDAVGLEYHMVKVITQARRCRITVPYGKGHHTGKITVPYGKGHHTGKALGTSLITHARQIPSIFVE